MKTKICSKCKVEKSVSDFGECKSYSDGYRYYCKDCRNSYERKLRIKSPAYRKSDIESSIKYHEEHKEEIKSYMKDWRKSEKGKQSIRKHKAKRRNLEYNELFENIINSEDIEWHHIDDEFVVALPKELHRIYMGSNHRENTMYIVEQIYNEVSW